MEYTPKNPFYSWFREEVWTRIVIDSDSLSSWEQSFVLSHLGGADLQRNSDNVVSITNRCFQKDASLNTFRNCAVILAKRVLRQWKIRLKFEMVLLSFRGGKRDLWASLSLQRITGYHKIQNWAAFPNSLVFYLQLYLGTSFVPFLFLHLSCDTKECAEEKKSCWKTNLVIPIKKQGN